MSARSPQDRAAVALGVVSVLSAAFVFMRGDFEIVRMRSGGVVARSRWACWPERIRRGRTHRSLGNPAPGRLWRWYAEALTLARTIDDPKGQFEALHGLGHTLRARGVHDPALAHHQAALDLARDLDQPNDQARAHDGLAQTHRAVGRHQQARRHWQQTLNILAELDLTETEDINAAQIRAKLAESVPNPPIANSGKRIEIELDSHPQPPTASPPATTRQGDAGGGHQPRSHD